MKAQGELRGARDLARREERGERRRLAFVTQ